MSVVWPAAPLYRSHFLTDSCEILWAGSIIIWFSFVDSKNWKFFRMAKLAIENVKISYFRYFYEVHSSRRRYYWFITSQKGSLYFYPVRVTSHIHFPLRLECRWQICYDSADGAGRRSLLYLLSGLGLVKILCEVFDINKCWWTDYTAASSLKLTNCLVCFVHRVSHITFVTKITYFAFTLLHLFSVLTRLMFHCVKLKLTPHFSQLFC